ncbi:MAG: helix-turn-helix transcriptional regulator [Clostridia bacterium]|nr:helix-turn-helix transcriptional regulator [Clostridia bacterium]
MNYADLGLQIRRLRKRKKMTQAQLARETGISAPYLGLIEQGRRIASLETFVRICNALQAEPGLLLAASLTRNENPLDRVSHLLAEAQKLLSPEENIKT